MGVLRPEGSLPPRVYWIRRTVVLVVAAAVVVLLVLGVRALLPSGDEDGDAAPPPTTSETPAPEDEDTSTGTPACDPASLSVALAADATTYPAGALPTFTLTLTNTGDAACLVDAGEAQRQILVTSGSDRIWASTDCAAADPLQLLLAPDQADERQVQWDRVRSAEGCATGQAEALPGTYQAVLTLAGVSTEPVVFGLE
ncbi:hypothetical protein [Cellulomonas sp. Marseille-Q8402]